MPWHCKNTYGYLKESTEAYDNAIMAWSIMQSLGWSLLAFCAMWGNVEAESGYNPWRWQYENLLPVGSPDIEIQNNHAYGLCQWDPAGKYIHGGVGYSGYGPNYSNQAGSQNDGTAQLYYLEATAVSSGQYYYPNYQHPEYSISYDNMKQMTYPEYSFEWATRAWFWNYERGTWYNDRAVACQYWYNTLGGITPPPPPPPGNIPIWLLFKIKKRNEGSEYV